MRTSKSIGLVLAIGLMVSALGCRSTPPSRLVYSAGFSFANYDYVVVGKPDSQGTSTAMYGFDVEFSNLIGRYNMKVIGNKEYDTMPSEQKARTLEARVAVSAGNKSILLSVSFDDSVTGRTGASISAYGRGNIFDLGARTKVFESASKTIVNALEKDKGIQVSDVSSQS